MSLKEIFQANHLNKLLVALAVVVVLIFIFAAGVFVGHEKARFSQRWGENYFRNVMGPGGRGGLLDAMAFGRPGFNAHSGAGQIVKIDGSNLIVKGQGNVEKIIVVSDKTIIREFNQNLKLSDLKIDDNVVVMGRPDNQGRIEARLIRVMPTSFSNNAATSTNDGLE